MRGFTKPPFSQESFREKKWSEASSKAQFPRTLGYTTTSVTNVTATRTAYTLEIPAKYISGRGDSISFRFFGEVAGTADVKYVHVYLGSSLVFTGKIPDSAAYEWAVSGEIFGTNTTNQAQYCSANLIAYLDPASNAVVGNATAAENLNADSELEVVIEGVAPGDITFSLGKVEYSPAPPVNP